MNIPLSKEEKIRILNTDDLYSIMQQILLREDKIEQHQEYFWVIGLANNQRILFIELVDLGNMENATVEPMEVFSLALQKRAVSIILCHHHPEGNLLPSATGKDLTDRLIQVGLIVNIPVLDHHLISAKGYLSFQETGLLQELKKSIQYVPSFEIAKRIRAEAATILEQKDTEYRALIEKMELELAETKRRNKEAIEDKKWKTAKSLKEAGVEPTTIAKTTGLSIKEINNL